MEAIALSDRLVDIPPVTLPKPHDVHAAITAEVKKRGADGAYLNGWDPLLQNGLPEPTLDWLNGIAPDNPLVIIHNSGHKAFFSSVAAAKTGLTWDAPDPRARDTAMTGQASSTAPEKKPPRCSRCSSAPSNPPTIRRCCSSKPRG